jgi:hypothetical protein
MPLQGTVCYCNWISHLQTFGTTVGGTDWPRSRGYVNPSERNSTRSLGYVYPDSDAAAVCVLPACGEEGFPHEPDSLNVQHDNISVTANHMNWMELTYNRFGMAFQLKLFRLVTRHTQMKSDFVLLCPSSPLSSSVYLLLPFPNSSFHFSFLLIVSFSQPPKKAKLSLCLIS